MIASDPTGHRISGGRTIVKARAVDDSGSLELTFFNQDYRKSVSTAARRTSSMAASRDEPCAAR